MADEKKSDLVTLCGVWYRETPELGGHFVGNLNNYLQVQVRANPQKKEDDKFPSHYVFILKRDLDGKSVEEESKKQIGAMWRNPAKEATADEPAKAAYYSGKMNDKVRLLLFQNKKKAELPETTEEEKEEKHKHPDGFLNMGNVQGAAKDGGTVAEKPPF